MDRRSFVTGLAIGGAVGAGAGIALQNQDSQKSAKTETVAAPAVATGKRTLTMVTSVPHGFAVFELQFFLQSLHCLEKIPTDGIEGILYIYPSFCSHSTPSESVHLSPTFRVSSVLEYPTWILFL